MIVTSRIEFRTLLAYCSLLASCLLFGPVGPGMRTASADPYTLSDGNSFINIETNNQATVYDWFVEEPVTGIYYDHLHELSNWFRVVGAADETSVHTLTKLSQVPSDTNSDLVDDTLTVMYQDLANQFDMEIVYNITGGAPGSGTSQLDEDITIFNRSSSPLSIHFYEYVDLDLHDTPGDDTIQLTGSNVGPNGLYQFDPQTDFTGSFEADRIELDEIGPVPNTLDTFFDGNPTNLATDLPPPMLPPSAFDPVGPDNVTWALQWNFVGNPPGIPPGFRSRIPGLGTARIHKEGILQMYYVVPEPACGTLVALGSTALLMLRRRR